jgi:hypothetical protein
MLGLPEDWLKPQPPDKDNRSLSWPEAEMLRLVNKTVRERDWPDSVFRSIVRLGIVERLSSMRPEMSSLPKIGMPAWAAALASDLGAADAATIGGLGIRVIGDLESLGRMPTDDSITDRPPAMVPAGIAAEAILAAIQASIEYGKREAGSGAPATVSLIPEPKRPAPLPSPARAAAIDAKVLARRAVGRARREVRNRRAKR